MTSENIMYVLGRFPAKLNGETVEVTVQRVLGKGDETSYTAGPNMMGCTKTIVNGMLQSINGKPSFVFDDGAVQYHDRDELHRENGPALVTVSGGGFWWYHGKYCGTGNEPDFDQRRAKVIAAYKGVHPRVEVVRQLAQQETEDV